MWSVCLVSCDCDFHSVYLPKDKDKRVMEVSDGRGWLRGKLGLVLMGRATLGKSLMQFSVDGRGCVPSLLFDLRPNSGGGNEENGDLLQKVPCAHCLTPCLRPCRGHCQLTAPPGTPGHSQPSLGQSLGGVTAPFFWVLVHTGFCLCLQKSVSPVVCKFCGLCGGVNGDLLQEGLCHTQVCCTQSPCPCGRPLLTCTSTKDVQTLKDKSGSVSVGSPDVHKVLFEPSEHLWQVWGLILNATSPLLPSSGASPLPFDMGCLFLRGSHILLLMVVQQLAVILESLQKKMSAYPSTPPSCTTSLPRLELCVHIPQQQSTPPDSWNHIPVEDLKLKLIMEVPPQNQIASCADSSLKITDQDLHL